MNEHVTIASSVCYVITLIKRYVYVASRKVQQFVFVAFNYIINNECADVG